MTKTKLLIGAMVSVLAVLAFATFAAGATKVEKYKVSGKLTAGAEVPKPKAPKGAGGSFTGTSTEKGSKVTLKWKLTFHGLSGKASAAHIHMGKRGKAGPVIVALCGPCKSGAHGTAKISSKIEHALEAGTAYVNVHTLKNAAGEIRAQLKAVEE